MYSKITSRVQNSASSTNDTRAIAQQLRTADHDCKVLTHGFCQSCNHYLAQRSGKLQIIDLTQPEIDVISEIKYSAHLARQAIERTSLTDLHVSERRVLLNGHFDPENVDPTTQTLIDNYKNSIPNAIVCSRPHLDTHVCPPCLSDHLDDHTCPECQEPHLSEHTCPPIPECTEPHLAEHTCDECDRDHLDEHECVCHLEHTEGPAHVCPPCRLAHLSEHTCDPCTEEHLSDHTCPECQEPHLAEYEVTLHEGEPVPSGEPIVPEAVARAISDAAARSINASNGQPLFGLRTALTQARLNHTQLLALLNTRPSRIHSRLELSHTSEDEDDSTIGSVHTAYASPPPTAPRSSRSIFSNPTSEATGSTPPRRPTGQRSVAAQLATGDTRFSPQAIGFHREPRSNSTRDEWNDILSRPPGTYFSD